MIVVADTGPINYLILCGYVSLIEALYGELVLPSAVQRELLHDKAPAIVRQWVTALPTWVKVKVPKNVARFSELGPGENQAIALALETKADFLLIDETRGRAVAIANGVAVKGILAVFEDADKRQLIDLPGALRKLNATSIFLSDELVQTVLSRHQERRNKKD